MTRWIDTADALIAILKYGPDTANEYQLYLDHSDESLIQDWDDNDEDMIFEDWIDEYEEEIKWLEDTYDDRIGHRLDSARYGILK